MIYSQAFAMLVRSSGHEWRKITVRFEENDPFVVTFDFDEFEWAIGRNLLATGISEDAGEMEVLVRSRDFRTTLILDPRNGEEVIEVSFPKRWLHGFLKRTAQVVPFGEEMLRYDLDAGLRELLNG